MMSSVMSNKQILTKMSKTQARDVSTKVKSELTSTTVDSTDSQSRKGAISKVDTFADVGLVGGLDSTELSAATSVIKS